MEWEGKGRREKRKKEAEAASPKGQTESENFIFNKVTNSSHSDGLRSSF